jgi:hypothetical protein
MNLSYQFSRFTSYIPPQNPSKLLMATCTYILRLESLAKKVESLIQSLQCATIQPSEDQYQSLRTLGARLSKAAANVPSEIDSLHERHAAALAGQKLISQAQSDRRDVIKSGQLKNRSVFGRNIVLFFEGPKDSVVDSETTKARKQLTRGRCQRICSLSPDGLISWAAAFIPTTWIANQMSGGLCDYLLEHIEPDEAQIWPSEIHNILDNLGAGEPLRGSCKYQEFLKGKDTFSENPSKKINELPAFKDGANALSPTRTKKRKRVEDRSKAPVAQIDKRKKVTSIIYNAPLTISTAEIEFAFSQAPIEKLPLLINLILKVIESSLLYAEERARQEPRTGCITVFIRPRKLDGSINIVAGSQTCHAVRNALDLIDLELQ